MKQNKGYWDHTIEVAFRKGEFSAKAKTYAKQWNRCSVGEKMNFKGRPDSEPKDKFLDNLGIAFSDAVTNDNPLLAGTIHRTIKFYNARKPQTAYTSAKRSGLLSLAELMKSAHALNDAYLSQVIAYAKNEEEDSTSENS